ncbi:uncharacterized protein BXIN_0781 [Babesia sp. Xinjiang]|uniref:uncharacterized protein n=1 Tax=Babesia sp. Xinjiang TaxID=462227 RepID=UPI000A21D6F7|nr:uncharacterized protein BXIN_0781 [Babesia sp. Xinjiang]ORM41343.1 hypothetical protein BXIN_0781 [Babesia sp. Xinjiang]
MKGRGDTFLTTHRIVFVKNRDKKFNEEFSSIALPYTHIDEPRFRQPLFGTNHLEGTIRPVSDAIVPINNVAKFYIYFESGCGLFLKGFYMYYARVRNDPAYTASGHPFSNAPESRSAFMDPNDPTHVYLAQPVTDGATSAPEESTENDENKENEQQNRPGWVAGASQAANTGRATPGHSIFNVDRFGEKCEGASSIICGYTACEVSLTLNSVYPMRVCLTQRSTLAFYLALIAFPLLSMLSEKTSVTEHAYLYGFTPDSVTAADRNFMVDSVRSLSAACGQIPTRTNEETVGKPGFSKWYSEPPASTPAVYRAVGEIVRKRIPTIEVKYVFDKSLGVTGSSVLLRLKCARCSSRGASLVVATIDTGTKSAFTMDDRALHSLLQFDSQQQDVLVLITERTLPYSAGTRQFLDDYFRSAEFPWQSGWLHHAFALDLGYGRCGSYELNYEGIDGFVPNPDVVTSFLSNAENCGLDVTLAGIWERIGRMSANSRPHLPHVAMLPRSIASFTVTCARQAGKREDNNVEKLLSTVILTMRMHNNLDTVLERSSNYYQMTSRDTYLPGTVYLLVIPGMLLGPTAELLYSAYTWDFHVLAAAISLFLLNACMGPWLSYRYLVAAAGTGFDGLDESSLSQVRVALALLVLGVAASLALNVLLLSWLPRRAFTGFSTKRSVLVREELLTKLGYTDLPVTLLTRLCERLRTLSSALRAKVDAAMCRFFPRSQGDNRMESMRKRMSMKLATLVEKWRSRYSGSVSNTTISEAKPQVLEPAPEKATSDPRRYTDIEVQTELQQKLEAMGGTQLVCPTNTGLPAPNFIVCIGTLFLALVFLYSLMVFHWPLAVLLTLLLVPSLRRVRVWNNTRCKCCVDALVCAIYLLFIFLLTTSRNMLTPENQEKIDAAFANGPLSSLRFVASPLYNLYLSARKLTVDDILSTLNTPFITQKILALAQQHVLLGSSTLPLIWFCAVPVAFHIVLIYTLARFYKPAAKLN